MTIIEFRDTDLSRILHDSGRTAVWRLSSLLLLAYAVIPLSYLCFLAFDPQFNRRLAIEDGFIETLGAFLFLLAALVLFLLYYRSTDFGNKFFGYTTNRNYFILLLALFFFICFGEEVSWGQRIFDWSTPQYWLSINSQSETNIHNLWLFKGRHPDGSEKTFWENMTNESRLIAIFWFTYCVLIPILYSMSHRLKSILNFIGLPIPSIIIGGLFVVNYISYRLATAIIDLGTDRQFIETKETNIAAIFAILAVYFFVRHDFVYKFLQPMNIGKR